MKNKLIISILIIFVAVACSTTTKITGSWVAEGYTPKTDFKKIAVITLANNQSNKLIIENTFVNRLKFLGYDATGTSSFIVPEIVTKENAKMIDKMMKERGIDAVMVLSLLQVKDDVKYVPGSSAYAPRPYYGGYYGYYYYNYNHMYEPGYYEKTQSLFLECNFYDLNDGKLVASIQTQTIDPANIDDLALSYSETILKKLISDKIIINKNSKHESK